MPGRKRSRYVLALDWDARQLRLVHAMLGKRGPQIDRMLSVGIPLSVDPTDPEQMGRHISRVLAEEAIGTKYAIVDVPRDQAILNTLSLPCQASDELPGIVNIQIAKQLPFAVGDAIIDYVVAPHEPDSAMADVLVAAVRHEVLSQYEATFAAAGLKLDRIGLRPYANKFAVGSLLRHAMPERVLMIDVGPTLTEISVFRDSFLAFSRAASVVVPEHLDNTPILSVITDSPAVTDSPSGTESADDGSDAGGTVAGEPDLHTPVSTRDVVNALMAEVTRSIEAYRASDPGVKMDHVVIGGDTGVEETLVDAVQQRLGVTAEIYNPASSLGWEPDEGASAQAFAASLGLVLAHADTEASHFDFLHPKKTVSQVQERLKKAPVVAAVAVLFIAAAGVSVAGLTKPQRELLVATEAKIKALEADASDNRKFMSVLKQAKAFHEDQFIWADVLFEIVGNLPPQEELVITHIEMNQHDARVILKTKAKNRNTATDVIRRLEAYRRDGRKHPRFKVQSRTQTEKARDRYPFTQDLRITILNDNRP